MDIEKLVADQREYFKTGETLSFEHRAAALDKIGEIIKRNEAEICEALDADLGKSRFESLMTETTMVTSELNFQRRHLKKHMRNKRVRTPLAQFYASSFCSPMPYGSVLIMAPWNYPFQLCMEPLVSAIAAGNCVVLKPSAYAAHTSALLARLIGESFDPRFITVVTGSREENARLITQKFDKIFFTGGTSVGRLVLESAAKNLTPVTLELGGKSPCLVYRDADIKMAAKRIAFGKCLNAGQTCVAPDYVLAHKSIKAELASRIQAYMREFLGENPVANESYPKIINERHFNRLLGLIEGESCLCGGNGDLQTRRIEPTVFFANEKSRAMQEEIFGPILPILEFDELEQAFEIVRNHENPLALYLFSKSRAVQKIVLESLQFGGGCINDTIIHLATSHMPFGGVGQSGMGEYHGCAGFECFSHARSIVKKSTLIDLPIRYSPYSAAHEKLLRMFMK